MLSDGNKKRAREILSSPDALNYMSSEESCEEEAVEPRGGPTPRKVRRLSWERRELRNIKVILDEAYFAALNEKQRRTSARVNRTEDESSRPITPDHALTQLTARVGLSAATKSKHFF